MGLAGPGSKTALPPRFPTKAEKANLASDFAQWQRAGSDQPKKLSGDQLKNEVGETLGVKPNRLPKTMAQKGEQAAGRWLNYEGKTLKSVEKTSDAIARAAGTPEAEVSSFPVAVLPHGENASVYSVVFRVETANGPRYVDANARTYESFDAWRNENVLPEGVMTFPKGGQLTAPAGTQLNELVSAHTPAVPDTLREGLANMAQTAGIMASVIVAGPALAGATGLPMIATGLGLTAQGIVTPALDLKDAYEHREINEAADLWENPRLRGDVLGLGTSVIGAAAIASASTAVGSVAKTGMLGSEISPLAPGLNVAAGTVGGELSKLSPALNVAATATGGVAVANQVVTCATSENCSPADLALSLAQATMFAGMTYQQANAMSGAPNTLQGTLDGALNMMSVEANARAYKPMHSDFITEGAGAAGLFGMKAVRDAGFSVMALEAREYAPGQFGRINDAQVFGPRAGKTPLGPEWLTGGVENPNYPALEAAGVEINATEMNRSGQYGDRPISMRGFGKAQQALEATLEAAQAKVESGDAVDGPADAHLPKDGLFAPAVIKFSELEQGTELRNVATSQAEIAVSKGDAVIKGGFSDAVRTQLGPDFPYDQIQHGQVVREAKINPGEDVEHHMADGRVFYSKTALFTQPVNVMKEFQITPEPTAWMESIGMLGQADAMKVLLNVDSKEQVRSFMGPQPNTWKPQINPEDGSSMWFHDNPYSEGVVKAFLAGSEVKELAEAPPDVAVERVLERARLIDPSIDEHLVGTHVTNWNKDPYSKGAWTTALKPGVTEEMLAPLQELYLGNAAYGGDAIPAPPDVDLRGFVDGAKSSGTYKGTLLAAQLRTWPTDPTKVLRLTPTQLVPRALRPGLSNAAVSNGVTILPATEPVTLRSDDDASSDEAETP